MGAPAIASGTDEALTIDAIEHMIFAGIGVTSRTLAETPAASDITLTQWRLLALLEEKDGGVRLGELAQAAAMSLPSASRLVTRLATRGLLVAVPDRDDGRALRIELTSHGRNVTAGVIAHRRALVAAALADSSISPTFAEDVRAAAEQIVKHIGTVLP